MVTMECWKNRVLLVTHGQKKTGPDPQLTEEGREQIAKLSASIPWTAVDRIYIGTGKRHVESAMALGIREDGPNGYDNMIGNPDSGEPIPDDPQGRWRVILANGRAVLLENYIMPTKSAMLAHLSQHYGNIELPLYKTVLLIGGRPMLESLQVPSAASGALYQIYMDGSAVRLA